MSKLPGSDVNPYAPPQVEVLESAEASLQFLRRPRSTKWAIALLLLKLGGVSWNLWTLLHEQSFTEFWESHQNAPIALLSPLLCGLGLILLIVMHRARVTYICTCLALLLLCSDGVWNGYDEWVYRVRFLPLNQALLEVAVYATILSLLLYLSYRFIFALPSRRYYRVGNA